MDKYKGLIKIGLWIVAALVALPIIRSIIDYIKSGINLDNAVNKAKADATQLNGDLTTIRTIKIKPWADELNTKFDSWINRATDVRDILNQLNNAEECLALSNYYQSTYNRSLLSQVKKEMGSFMAPFSAKFGSLKPFIQQSLI